MAGLAPSGVCAGRWKSRRIAGPVIAFCGIAHSQQFFAGLEAAGLHLASRVAFADHHPYAAHDIDCLLDAARTVGAAALVTTEKDRARLGAVVERIPQNLPLKTAALRIEIDEEAAAIDWLLARPCRPVAMSILGAPLFVGNRCPNLSILRCILYRSSSGSVFLSLESIWTIKNPRLCRWRMLPGEGRNSFASPALFPALIALLFAVSATAVRAAAQQIIGPGPTAPVASADYAGEDTCATCHADVAKDFAANPHHRLALEHGGKGVTCESCHGPGKAHVESGGDVTKIVRFTSASAERIDSTCLRCHAAAHPNFQRSPHGEAGLSCTTCHSVHHAAPETYLLAGPQPQLCYRCHAEVRTAFSMPFHHRVPESLMECTDCHDPHGTFENSRLQLRDTADENAICTKCHTDTLGPFVYGTRW